MAKKYQSRRTITGLPTGKRVKWLTLPPIKGIPHRFFLFAIEDGDMKYVGWTGQIGLCTIKGTLHHCVPGNLFVAPDLYHCVIVSSWVESKDITAFADGYVGAVNKNQPGPFGTSQYENCANLNTWSL